MSNTRLPAGLAPYEEKASALVEPLLRYLGSFRRQGWESAGPPAFTFNPEASLGLDVPASSWDSPLGPANASIPPQLDPGSIGDETVTTLLARIQRQEISADEVITSYYQRIQQLNPRLNAFLHAELPDCSKPFLAPLYGLPFGVKDLIQTQDMPTTCGSLQLQNHASESDAEVVSRLRQGGGSLMGKLNTHEFAAGGTGENLTFGRAQNPWNMERIPGGSSSGAGVAVAAGLIPMAIGTDTGGSVRIPAACCGVVGFKPTYGVISARGVYPLAWSLDHVGVLCRAVSDLFPILKVLNPAAYGSMTPPSPIPAPQRLRIGVPWRWLERVTSDVQATFHHAITTMRDAGAMVENLDWPNPEDFVSVNRAIAMCETTAWHEPMARNTPHLYGENIRPRIGAGFGMSALDYLCAQRLRAEMCRELGNVWTKFDIIATPTLTEVAPKWSAVSEFNPILLTAFGNVLGIPAISVPCGLGVEGMPVGIHLAGPPHRDFRVLQIAYFYEQLAEWKLHSHFTTGER